MRPLASEVTLVPFTFMTAIHADSWLSPAELAALGLRACGTNVKISRLARIYSASVIEIGSDVRIDDFCILSGGSGIRLGNFIHIAAYSALYGAAGIEMMDFSGVSSRVTIYSESDDYSGRSLTNPTVPREFRKGLERGAVRLEKHALIGAGSTLLPGVTVGEGAAVGAHSLVTKSCEPWTISFGSPARRVGVRDRALLELEAAFLAGRSKHVG